MRMQPNLENMLTVEASCAGIETALRIQGIGDERWNDLPRPAKYASLRHAIGNTPIATLHLPDDVPVATKQEYCNPSRSHYDRAFLETLEAFETTGLIEPGDELRDITSGSGGISLALLAHYLGYQARITVPDELPEHRLIPMFYFGAVLREVGPGYIQQAAAIQTAEIQAFKDHPAWSLTRPEDKDQRAYVFTDGERRICYLNHSENKLSPQAFQAIGHELVRQLTEAPAAVMLAIGNWTTIAGISPVLREAWPDTKLVGYHGENTVVHDNFGTTVEGVRLRFKDDSLLDDTVIISDAERNNMDDHINTALPNHQKLGHSSLMGLAGARNYTDLGKVVTFAYDQKIRY